MDARLDQKLLDTMLVIALLMVTLHLATLKVLLTRVMDQVVVVELPTLGMAMEGLLVTLSIHVKVLKAVKEWLQISITMQVQLEI